MSLSAKLAARKTQGKPIRVGLFGADKFGSMFPSQVPTICGLEVAFIADRDLERARAACRTLMYKPFHLIGLELSISALNAVLRGEVTGTPLEWRADVASAAKRNLKGDDILDGEGGYTVCGKLAPASRSLAEDLLPIGLAHGVKVKRDIPAGSFVKTSDVQLEEDNLAVQTRREDRMSRTAAAA
jgi:predicted homoserine dehydrogenase-like protein